MESFFGRPFPLGHAGNEEPISAVQWTPAVDVTEDDKEFLVKAELPDMKKEEVKVSVEQGNLTISGERRAEKEEKGKKFHRVERSYGSFMRRFSLPEGVDATKINAEFKDGLLCVHLPEKRDGRSPRRSRLRFSSGRITPAWSSKRRRRCRPARRLEDQPRYLSDS